MNRPTRVLLVGPSLDIMGGQAVQADRLLERLRTLPGVEVSFQPVNPRLPGPLRVLQRVKYLRTIVTSAAYVGGLVVRIPRADIVHAFSAGYWSFLLAPVPALLLGRLAGRHTVLNYHTGEAEDHLTRHGKFAIPLMRLAHAIVVPSEFLVTVFSRFGLHAVAVANFIEPGRLPYRVRSQPGPRFLSNRNLEPLYNVACTLKAFHRIQRTFPEASLTVVGDGGQRHVLHRIASSLGVRHVTFAGRVSPEEMAKHYDAADIYLNSPSIDNMPLSIIEAFAVGLPVVSTDAGGIPFIAKHEENALLVPCNDDEALAAAALRLLREPDLAARLAAAARAEVLDRYTWPQVAEQWLRIYGVAQELGARG